MEPLHHSRPSGSAATDSSLLRFHVASFGCRASQSEGASIEAQLEAAGRSRADTPYSADVIVINSCTVTSEADRDVRRLIRRLERRNPSANIIVTGCYAQRSPGELAEHANVRYVVGNSHKDLVAGLAEECLDDPLGPGRAEVFCSQTFELHGLEHQGSSGRTRATVKIQDGCSANCSFCIIPAVRGRSRSLPMAAVTRQVQSLVEQGYREVVLSGIHLGSWGRDLGGGKGFVDLVTSTLKSVPELESLRLSSVEPMEVTQELVHLAATSSRIAPHFHVPLQSGSEPILRAMRRPYKPAEYADRIRWIREASPDAAIGADVMVGFPGETDQDFLETVRLVEALPLTYLHVFPYSVRPGTAAAELSDQVPHHVSRFRSRQLTQLGFEKNFQFRSRFVGRRLRVLSLGGTESVGRIRGLSDNFIGIALSPDLEVNRWHQVEVCGLTDTGLESRGRTTRDTNHPSRTTMAAETV